MLNNDEEPEFWDIEEDEEGDDVITITTDDLETERAEAAAAAREEALSAIPAIRAEAYRQAKADAEAEMAARIRRIADGL